MIKLLNDLCLAIATVIFIGWSLLWLDQSRPHGCVTVGTVVILGCR